MRLCKTMLVVLAVFGTLLPSPVLAAERTNDDGPSAVIARIAAVDTMRDVRLDANHALNGRLFSTSGQPLAVQDVALVRNGEDIAATRTDAAGRFRFNGLAGGVYSLRHAGDATACRVWTPDTAPPAAVGDLLLVAGEAARGQNPFCCFFGAEPIMIGVLLAAAVAIPLSVHNSGPDQPPSSP